MSLLIQNKKNKFNGFTMIELIVVIIILGIMAVTVVPKFFNSTGFEEYTYQAEVITKLRSIQLRAMQQTDVDSDKCHMVVVKNKVLGIPENCDETVADGWQGENKKTGESGTTNVKIEHDNVTFAPIDFSFTFDSMGRPDCGICLITVIGDTSLEIIIESEGYIHEN